MAGENQLEYIRDLEQRVAKAEADRDAAIRFAEQAILSAEQVLQAAGLWYVAHRVQMHVLPPYALWARTSSHDHTNKTLSSAVQVGALDPPHSNHPGGAHPAEAADACRSTHTGAGLGCTPTSGSAHIDAMDYTELWAVIRGCKECENLCAITTRFWLKVGLVAAGASLPEPASQVKA